MTHFDARTFLKTVFDAAVASAMPGPAILTHLPDKPRGRCIVVGAGKAAAAMAAAVDAAWPDVPLSGIVVTRDGHAEPAGRIQVLEASHPVPDHRSQEAARRILAAVQGLGPDDLVLALISGGASALLALPRPPLALADKQAVNHALLTAGVGIGAMNLIRKRLSAIKGGWLAQAATPARLVTLTMSDVPGDDPGDIGSGPTLPDEGTNAQALTILAEHAIKVPDAVRRLLEQPDPPRPVAPVRSSCHVIVKPADALHAAAAAARAANIPTLILGDRIEAESREVGRMLAGIALSARQHDLPAPAPLLLLSGGETAVTIGQGPAGRGGRNMECALAFAVAAQGAPGIWALMADSDGIDGTEDAAGAIVGPDTLSRARNMGLDAASYLARHDSYSLFAATGELLITGPTRTNVNDIRAVFIG
ncbi:glycerate kinase [Sphingobium sp. HBC34]|uniref:Glycerate kinase n=1 Tax=Sphingobium cyanobacteriorum TaxID=3063954 RepID=A0ABT8ZPA5_9SPHN|nr:glycerate kinase [Sphingobium sp. HBC34]MDO7836369.1 glycerate kinase [Sphingobium sp. HBC34]